MINRRPCRSCGAEVLWVATPNGKAIPLDPEPRADGNLEIVGDLARYVDHRQPSLTGEPRHVSHFATCPDAARWRKGRDA